MKACPICFSDVVGEECPRMNPDGTHQRCPICTGPIADVGCRFHYDHRAATIPKNIQVQKETESEPVFSRRRK